MGLSMTVFKKMIYYKSMDMPTDHLSSLADAVLQVFETKTPANHEPKISVNRFVSEIASWYEKLRNVMELQEDAVILKNAIERILKRRLLLGGTGDKVAEPLIRELVWARYFPDNSLPQSFITNVAHIINLYLDLKHQILEYHPKTSDKMLNEWMFEFMSSQISLLLAPNPKKDVMSNYMYHVFKDHVEIPDDTEDTKNVQVYLAVRRAFAKDDVAFLRYYLFQQIFPELTTHNIDAIAKSFPKGFAEIEHQMKYKLREKIYLYIKRQTPVFLILDDVLHKANGNARGLINATEKFATEVLDSCAEKYKNIRSKVNNAIIRSVFFLLLTKVVLAFAIEGTYDKFMYGEIQYVGLAINIVAPPILMIIVSLFVRTPGIDNSKRILAKIMMVLYETSPRLAPKLTIYINPKKTRSLLTTVFALLWLVFFGTSFGLMAWVLTKVHMNIVSQGVFMFFIAIVSFLSWRINLTANAYSVDKGQGLLTPFIDILFLPIIKVGMRLTDGISQINIFIFIFDFIIEAPFKVVFSFFEQLFAYLHAKREDLG
jgi:hypothetical protein